MGGTATDLVMDLRMATGNLARDVAGAKRVLGGLGSSLGGIGAAGSRGLAAIGAAVSLSVREFAKADHAAQGLKSALAANGAEVDENFKSMTAFAKATRDQTVYSTDFIQELQAMALNLGVSAKQTDAVVEAGIGLGEKFFGGDAQRGVKAASLAVMGNMRELQRLIPALKSAHSEQAKLDMISRAGAQGFQEAKNKALTFSGAISSLGRSYHEAGAAIGSAFAPEIQKLAGVVQIVSEKIAGMSDEQKAALATQVELAAGASAGAFAIGKVGTVMTGLRGVFGATTPLVGAVGFALAGIGSLFVNLIGKGDTFGERLTDVWGKIKVAAVAAGGFIQKTWNQVTDGIILMYYEMLEVFGGGDADKMFQKYREGIEAEIAAGVAAEKKAQKDRTDAAAKGTDKRKGLEDESVRHSKGSISSISESYKKIQNAILGGESGSGGGAAGGVGHPIVDAMRQSNQAMAKASRGSAYLADLKRREAELLEQQRKISVHDDKGAVYSDNPDKERQIEAELKRNSAAQAEAKRMQAHGYTEASVAAGENRETAEMNPIKLAANVARAKKELASIETQLANVAPGQDDIDSMDDQKASEQTKLRDSIRQQLEARKRALEAYVYRGGRDHSDTPNSPETLIPELQAMKDKDAAGNPSFRREQMERNNEALQRAGKDDKTMRDFVETPGSKMAGTITQADAKRFAEAAILLKSAAEDMKNAPKVGVVRDNQ